MTVRLPVAFVPLVDAAPVIVAHELGFAAEEGLTIEPMSAPSWSMARDMLSTGQVAAAHMLSPIPVAVALGLGGRCAPLAATSVISVNGTVIGVSNTLAHRLRGEGHTFDFADAKAAGRALIAATDAPLRIGVPFPFSMHAELLNYWLTSAGLPAPQNLVVSTVPPPLMADAMKAGDIDAFCVGEPWGSRAVEEGAATLLLPGRSIWSFAPEKVLAVRESWAEAEPDLSAALIRALWRAGRWLSDATNQTVTSEILARPAYLNCPAELVDRALSGRFTISPQGDQRHVEGFVEFHKGAACFPWRSQGEWIGLQLARRLGLDQAAARAAAAKVFRSDLHRAALGRLDIDLPGASSKVEGAISAETPVATASGRLTLLPNEFFDSRVFDPRQPI